jgi:cobaltochelatase CobN
MKKILSIMWHSHCGTLKRASKALEGIIDVGIYSSRRLDEGQEEIDALLKEAENADVILLYRSTESVWDIIEKSLNEIGKSVPIVCVGHDPSYWTLSTVRPDIVTQVHTYIMYNGEENFTRMLRYIANAVCGVDIDVEPPKPIPWEGLYHPDAPDIFDDIEEYLKWYDSYKRKPDFPKTEGAVGLLFSRFHWANKNLGIEDALIRKVESLGLGVIPAFSYSVRDEGLGTKGSGEVVCEYFLKDGGSRIDALINLQMFLLGSGRATLEGGRVAMEGVDILKVFVPWLFLLELMVHHTT